MDDANETVVAYKGFNRDLTCRGFQYEIGKTYEHDDEVKACESGFHACEHPLDVFRYYAPATSRFAEVTLSGELSRDSEDSKIAASSITIVAELQLHELVERAIKYAFDRAEPSQKEKTDEGSHAASAAGDYGAALASGYCGTSTATGDYGAALAAGPRGAATATGDYGAASATDMRGAASATGRHGAASATGDFGAASATGRHGAASATGDFGAALATGTYGAALATGTCGAALAAGDDGAALATGTCGAALATGTCGAASAAGDYGAASATGRNSRASGKDGCALFLVERDDDWRIVNVWAGIVGRDGIKPNTFYTLRDNKPVEVED